MVHLRFDIRAWSLPEEVKARLPGLGDQRISRDGVVVIKTQEYRSLDKNRVAALHRLSELIARVATPPAPRRPTRVSIARRIEGKTRRAAVKVGRGRGGE